MTEGMLAKMFFRRIHQNNQHDVSEQKKSFFMRKIIVAVAINIIVLSVLLMIFEPTEKIDDYEMRNLLYGGVTGERSPFIMYSDILFGRFLLAFINVEPSVDWYWVIQYVFVFLCFSIVTYILLERKNSAFFVTVGLFYLGYEVYIRCTFTKTAGVMVMTALALSLYVTLWERSMFLLCLAGLILTMGLMIRRSVFLLGIFIFGFYFCIYFLDCKKNKSLFKKFFLLLVLSLGYFSIYKIGGVINQQQIESNSDWKYQMYNQQALASLYDYGIPDYEEYEDEYKKLNVSKNDYIVWFEMLDSCDTELITPNLTNEIKKMGGMNADKTDIFIVFKKLLDQCVKESGFYFFLFGFAYVIAFSTEKKIWKYFLCFFPPLSALAINMLRGRLNHHVSFEIWIMSTFCILCLFNLDLSRISKCKMIPVLFLIVLVFAVNYYEEFANSSYPSERYGIVSLKEEYSENRELIEYLNSNSDYIYMMETKELYNAYPCYKPFEVIEQGIYSNIFLMHDAYRISGLKLMEELEIDNIWDSIIGKNIYYVCSSKYNYLDEIKMYIKDHYCSNVKSELVEERSDIKVYRFICSEN